MNDRVRIDRDGAIARVVLTRADRHNGMDFAMLDAVCDAARSLSADRAVRVVILSGDGPSFCAGLDVRSLFGNPTAMRDAAGELAAPGRNRFQAWSMLWRELAVPVIAVIHGNCFGAGLQLALGADIRFATPDAKLSIMEAKWGLVPDMGGAALLRELLRIDVALELTMTGRIVSGADAHALGLVTHVAADPLAAALALAREFETRSPDAVAAAKRLLHQAWHGSEEHALAAERAWQRRVIGGGNQQVAIRRNTVEPDAVWHERTIE